MTTHSNFFRASLLALPLLFTSHVNATDGPRIDASTIVWENAPGYEMTVTVAGDGQVHRYHFEAGEAAVLGPHDAQGKRLADGTYTWQLSASPVLSDQEKKILFEGRELGIDLGGLDVQGTIESGAFTVRGGAFVTDKPSAGDRDDAATKDHVIQDTLIVNSHACIGYDCNDGQSFSYEQLRLKANNTRIRFQDTSEGTFPGNDWEIYVNDSTPSGRNMFAVRDVTANPNKDIRPFVLEAGAGANALYVNDSGHVGLGTATPGTQLHILDYDSPKLRLEQDGSMGFTEQTWDIAGNEANFFVMDTTANTLPFRIEPGAPQNSLYVAGSGYIGLGTEEPQRPIHVQSSNPHITFEHTEADGERWNVGANNSGGFIISRNNSGSRELEFKQTGEIFFRHGSQVLATLDADGNLTTTGTITTSGTTCGGGCDLVFQPGYELESIEEHAAFMWENSFLPSVGPTQENGAAWNLSEKVGGMLNELEKAHIYIEQLHGELEQQQEQNRDLAERLARLEAVINLGISHE